MHLVYLVFLCLYTRFVTPPLLVHHTPGECSSLQEYLFRIILFSYLYSIPYFPLYSHVCVCI